MTRTTDLFAAALASAFLFTGAASAQPMDGAVRQFQRQPLPQTAQPLRPYVRNFGVTDAIRGPRFKVEAINFRAINESGRDIPFTSDEVFATFHASGHSMMTSTFNGIDTNESRTFDTRQNCIWAAVDPDGQANGRWSCAEGGARGPVQFTIELFDEDTHLIHGFCIVASPVQDDLAVCPQDDHTLLFRHTFNYDVATMLQRLEPSCRCFTETARHAVDSLTHYEVSFRITRTDTEPEFVFERAPLVITPIVHASGSLTAPLLRGFEFDAGTVVQLGADFTFSRTGVGSATRLTPAGGAKIWAGGTSARGHAACYAARNSASYVTSAVATPAIGEFACYVTNDGRVGEFQVTALSTTLSVAFTTWQ